MFKKASLIVNVRAITVPNDFKMPHKALNNSIISTLPAILIYTEAVTPLPQKISCSRLNPGVIHTKTKY